MPENYSGVLRLIPLGRQYLNSILQTGAITIGQVVTSALAAYAFVFLDLRWRGLWFALFLSTMMIPYESIIIPNYLFISEAGPQGHHRRAGPAVPGHRVRHVPAAAVLPGRSRRSCATRPGSTAPATCGS